MSEKLIDVLLRRKELLLLELEKIDHCLAIFPEYRRKSQSKTSHIINIAKNVLTRDPSSPTPIATILREVQVAGIDLGANPAQNLSATLSKAQEFKNVRGSGWVLVAEPLHYDWINVEITDNEDIADMNYERINNEELVEEAA